jgi:hypothetical protein
MAKICLQSHMLSRPCSSGPGQVACRGPEPWPLMVRNGGLPWAGISENRSHLTETGGHALPKPPVIPLRYSRSRCAETTNLDNQRVGDNPARGWRCKPSAREGVASRRGPSLGSDPVEAREAGACRGTSAASLAMKSSGSHSTWVVPFRHGVLSGYAPCPFLPARLVSDSAQSPIRRVLPTEGVVEVTRAMEHTDYVDSAWSRPEEHDVPAEWQTPNSRGEFFSGPAHHRFGGPEGHLFVHLLVGGSDVVCGDEGPDLQNIGLRLGPKRNQ